MGSNLKKNCAVGIIVVLATRGLAEDALKLKNWKKIVQTMRTIYCRPRRGCCESRKFRESDGENNCRPRRVVNIVSPNR